LIVWERSFTEPDLFDNNMLFDNTTPIYLLWRLGLDFECTVLAFFTENNENEHLIFCEFHGRQHLVIRTHPNDQQQNKITIYSTAYE